MQGPAAFYTRGLSLSDGLRFCAFFPRFFWKVLGRVFKKRSLRTSEPQNLKFLKIPFVNSLSPLSSFFLLKSLRYRTSASNYGFSNSDQCCSSSIKLQVHFFHPFLLFCLSYFLFILTKKQNLRSMESKFQNFISPPSPPIWSRQRCPPSPMETNPSTLVSLSSLFLDG